MTRATHWVGLDMQCATGQGYALKQVLITGECAQARVHRSKQEHKRTRTFIQSAHMHTHAKCACSSFLHALAYVGCRGTCFSSKGALNLKLGCLHRWTWTRNPVTHLACCGARGLIGAADGLHSVTLYSYSGRSEDMQAWRVRGTHMHMHARTHTHMCMHTCISLARPLESCQQ